MTKDQFLSDLERLKAQHQSKADNLGCVECPKCSGCIDCVFCESCTRCYRSRYSVGCVESSLLTHSHGCRASYSLAYCQDCDHCGDSNYLVGCSYCFECDYCFGCVGLVKQDFQILNVKYSRSDYFRLVAQLRGELGLPAMA